LFPDAFIRLARDAGMDEAMRNAITDHQGNAGVGRGYGADFGLKTLWQAVGRIALPKSVAGIPVTMTC
jgi:hypothetical protein